MATAKISRELGGSSVEAAVACASGASAAAQLGDFAFGTRPFANSPTARFTDCTCCVIRPHAVQSKDVGGIVRVIEQAGKYEISAMSLVKLDQPAAAEFLEVYDGVIAEHDAAVKELCSGPCLALELRGHDAVNAFRQTAGPWDVDFAKEIRPKSIRAKFGTDAVRNAVHCTDLTDDGEQESRYFFEVLG